MGSSQGSGSQSGFTSRPEVPAWLRPYYKGTASQLEQAQSQLPSISQLYGMIPELGTAGMTDTQSGLLGQFQDQANNPTNAAESQAGAGYGNFLGGSNGDPSGATQAEINQFSQLQAPQINQQSALMGQGNSGAALTALAQGQESALVPFLQQGEQNQLTAAGGLANLGGQEFNNQQNALNSSWQAQQLPQQLAQEQLQNQYNQQEQQLQFAQGIQTGGQSQFPSLIGGGSTTANFNSAAPKF